MANIKKSEVLKKKLLLEDSVDLAVIAKRRKEKTISHKDFLRLLSHRIQDIHYHKQSGSITKG